MFSRIIKKYQTVISFFFLLTCITNQNLAAGEEVSAYGLTSFTFANYLGTGFYTTSGQEVFVVQLPLHYTIKEKTDTDAGWKLNLPITIGFINFDNFRELEDLPDIEDVATVTFLPGIEYQYPVTPDWTIIPFADYGFARDLNHTSNILITALGIKSYADFQLENAMLTLGNKFLYAREKSKDTYDTSDYSVIETGINYRIKSNYSYSNGNIYNNFYYINFYYPDDLVFFERTENPVRVGIEHEVGFTLSNLPDFLFMEKPQIGFGIRMGNDVKVYRLLFSAPF